MNDLMKSATELEAKIAKASPQARLALQPELARVLREMQEHGVAVSARLPNLDAELTGEVVEARFDNVPL